MENYLQILGTGLKSCRFPTPLKLISSYFPHPFSATWDKKAMCFPQITSTLPPIASLTLLGDLGYHSFYSSLALVGDSGFA